MLKIVITPPLLTRYDVTYPSCDLDNPEWLRAMDRKNAVIYIHPYYNDGYFRQQIIEPILNGDGLPYAGYVNESLLDREWHKDGIDYIISSLYNTKEYADAVQWLIEFQKRDMRYNELQPRNNWNYKIKEESMYKTIDQRIKEIMSQKQVIGEFSLDLYYNDCDDLNPYTAKVHSVINPNIDFHARAICFDAALDQVEDYLKTLQ